MKFDFHVHSNFSHDSEMTVDEAVAAAKKAGLSGIAISDHNVFKQHSQNDFYIVPACEFSTDAGHLLVLFMKEPFDASISRNEHGVFHWKDICNAAHRQGALVFYAHPFAPPHEHSDELYKHLDGVEAFNGRVVHSRLRSANEKALELTKTLKKPFTVGSDAHCPEEVGRAYLELDLPESPLSEPDFEEKLKEALLNRRGRIFTGSAPAATVFKCKYRIYKKKHMYKRWLKGFIRYILSAIKAPFKRENPGNCIIVYTEEELL